MSNATVLNRAIIAPVDVSIKAARLFGCVVRIPEERMTNYLLHWVPKHGKRLRGRLNKKLAVLCLRGALFTGVDNIARDAAK